MNRYNVQTGHYEHVPDAEPAFFRPPTQFEERATQFEEAAAQQLHRPSGQSGILENLGGSGGLGGLFSRLGGRDGILSKLGGGGDGILSRLGGSGGAGILSGLGGSGGEGILSKITGKDGILSKLTSPNLELEDLILVGVFYLLYRESKDIEFLLIAGSMLFL